MRKNKGCWDTSALESYPAYKRKEKRKKKQLGHLGGNGEEEEGKEKSLITSLFDDFRCHPKRGSNKCVAFSHLICELTRNSKIS